MQVQPEKNLGSRSVLEYLLSSARSTFHAAGRERRAKWCARLSLRVLRRSATACAARGALYS